MRQCLRLSLLHGEREEVSGEDAPVNLRVRIDPRALQQNREKALAGARKIADGNRLALEISSLVAPADFEPSRRMQPPCVPATTFTSKPCSSGFSQRSAMPTPASALPVAIASRSCSVEPAKLTVSPARPCFAKMPLSMA